MEEGWPTKARWHLLRANHARLEEGIQVGSVTHGRGQTIPRFGSRKVIGTGAG